MNVLQETVQVRGQGRETWWLWTELVGYQVNSEDAIKAVVR